MSIQYSVRAAAEDSDNWERSDFPIACESCYGENPYVRMMKNKFSAECKMCARPFTVYKWKAGNSSRYRTTAICQTCAKLKNLCQVCLLDLVFGLPSHVRDAIIPSSDPIPASDVNREWFAEQAENKEIPQHASYSYLPPSQTQRNKNESQAGSRPAPYKRNNTQQDNNDETFQHLKNIPPPPGSNIPPPPGSSKSLYPSMNPSQYGTKRDY